MEINGENSDKIEDLKSAIDTIQEAASIDQRHYLPNLRRGHITLQAEYQRAVKVFKDSKAIQESYKHEMDAEKARETANAESLKCLHDVRISLNKGNDVCDLLLKKERQDVLQMIDLHEDKMIELGDLFHQEPFSYTADMLRQEVDTIRENANRLQSELTDVEKVLNELRLKFQIDKDGSAATSIPYQLSKDDKQSLKTVLNDSNNIEDTLQRLAEGDREFEKRSRHLQQEITNTLVSRDGMIKNLQNPKNTTEKSKFKQFISAYL